MWIALVVALLALAVLMPTYGLAAQLRLRRATSARERTENALKHLLRQATDGHSASFQSLKGELGLSDRVLLALTERLQREGLIEGDGAHLKLTPEGERLALHVLRAHRLWEVYLAEELGVPVARVHVEAERQEHRLSPQQVDRLSAWMGHPNVDPHGDPIPTADGQLAHRALETLLTCPLNTPVTVARVTDQDAAFLRFIESHNLKPGQTIEVEERDEVADSVRLKGSNDQRTTIGTRAASKLLVTS